MAGNAEATLEQTPQTNVTERSEEVQRLHSEVTRLQSEAEEYQRLNGILADAAEQFIGTLAHDVKNPLAAIKINVQSLKRAAERGAVPEGDALAERLDRIETAVSQTLDVLAAARARLSSSAGARKPLQRVPLDLVELVGSETRSFCEVVGPDRIRLDCRAPRLVGQWDRERLRRAVHELLENAVKFSAGSEQVTVTVDHEDGTAVLKVADEGIGIPSRDLLHVCERFYRAENVLGRHKGAGLGLFETRATVTDHGGTLSVESTEGAGSVFTVRLPIP